MAIREFPDQFSCQGLRCLSIAGVVTRLPAASLRSRYGHFASGCFKQFQRRKTDVRPHQVNQAGHEQPDSHEAPPVRKQAERGFSADSCGLRVTSELKPMFARIRSTRQVTNSPTLMKYPCATRPNEVSV